VTGVIRTIGGDLPAELAGPTYVHEHLIIDTPLVAETMPQIHLHSVDEAVAELQTCVAAGVRTMVDAMPAASGRDPERLSRISVLSGVRVVAATGLHTARYYQDVPWTEVESPEQMADRFVADIEVGIDRHDYRGETVERTGVRAGVVKVAALGARLTVREERLFEAGAMTWSRTGAPVLTHTEGGLVGWPRSRSSPVSVCRQIGSHCRTPTRSPTPATTGTCCRPVCSSATTRPSGSGRRPSGSSRP
jgi:5-phospho-D-xylono-1,4-lactonase